MTTKLSPFATPSLIIEGFKLLWHRRIRWLVIIPLLITIVRQTTLSLEGASVDANSLNVVVLIVLNVVSFALSYILFPYLWRE